MDVDVRTIESDEEITEYLTGLRVAFLLGAAVTQEQVDWARGRWDFDRTWAAFDGGRLCGTTRTFPTDLRLPGGAALTVSALTMVTVLPTHTRRGHLTRMMRAQLDHAVAAGEPASILIAAEWPIYGRFGYGPATQIGEWRVDTARARVVGDRVGSCEIVSAQELRAAAPAVFDRHHESTPGAISRDDRWWDLLLDVDPRPGSTIPETRVRVVHRDPGGVVDGYAVYDAHEEWVSGVPKGRLEVKQLIAATAIGERELWRYLCGVDLATEVTWDGSPAPALPHLLHDGRTVQTKGGGDFVWARLLDVRAAMTARGYVGSGSVVVDVSDPFLDRGGRFALDVSPEGASCAPTRRKPDLTLDVGALGAGWLGGTPLSRLAATGLVDEHTPGALERATAMLSWPVPPWCSTDF